MSVDERNDAIRDAYAEGNSLRDIANAVGLSWSGVSKILKKAATP